MGFMILSKTGGMNRYNICRLDTGRSHRFRRLSWPGDHRGTNDIETGGVFEIVLSLGPKKWDLEAKTGV